MARHHLWQRMSYHALCASVAAVFVTTPVYATDVATVIAAVQTAKLVAEKTKEFLEFIGYIPHGKAGPSVSEKLDELAGMIADHDQKSMEAFEKLEDHAVDNNNRAMYGKYRLALNDLTSAREYLTALRAEPANQAFRAQVALDTENAIRAFEFWQDYDLFSLEGPDLGEKRFHHLFTYPGYLNALALRVAYIQHQYGPRGFTQEPFRSELQASAAKLRWLVAEITGVQVVSAEEGDYLQPDMTYKYEQRFPAPHPRDKNLVAYTLARWDRGYNGPFECWGAQVWLQDHILYDRIDAPEHKEFAAFYFPEGSVNCDPFAGGHAGNTGVYFHFNNLISDLVTAKTTLYGAPEIAAMADMLDNYTLYGYPTPPPPPAFAKWDYMAPFNAYWARKVTFAPEGGAVPGVTVRDIAVTDPRAWDEHLWWVPNANGMTPIFHTASGLCLTPSADGRLTLEVCDGADDQLWTRGTQYALSPQQPHVLRHVVSRLCLSTAITTPGFFGNYFTPGLGLEPCENQRTDQTWTRLNMSWTYGVPRSSSHHMGLAPAGEAVAGASVSLVQGGSAPEWLFSGTYGLFVHEASQLCLTRKAGPETLTLEACTGAAEQLWSKDIHRFIRHLSSGTCLSSVKVTVYNVGKFGKTYSVLPLLHLSTCENGRADQIWDDFNNAFGL